MCADCYTGLIPWGPLNAGRLARPVSSHKSTSRSEGQGELSNVQTEIINRVEELAKKKGWTMSQVALACKFFVFLTHCVCSLSSPRGFALSTRESALEPGRVRV